MEPDARKMFIKYYEEFVDSLFTFFYYRIGRNRMLAEDLTAETFMKALEHFSSFDTSRSFKSWIFTIARRHLIDHYRAHRPTTSIDDAEPIPSPSFLKELSIKMDTERVLEKLDTLPVDDRELIIMRYVTGLEPQEMADILGKTPGSVRVALHRALQSLRAQFSDETGSTS